MITAFPETRQANGWRFGAMELSVKSSKRSKRIFLALSVTGVVAVMPTSLNAAQSALKSSPVILL